jgi:hypothetical protein
LAVGLIVLVISWDAGYLATRSEKTFVFYESISVIMRDIALILIAIGCITFLVNLLPDDE